MKTDKPTGPEFVEHCLGMVHDAQKANPHYSPKDYLLFMKRWHWNLLRIEHCKAPGGIGVETGYDLMYRRKFQGVLVVIDNSLEQPLMSHKTNAPKYVGQCQ